MKVLIYFENDEGIKTSGIGRALSHQLKACELAGIETTRKPDDTYDLAHINTYFGKSRKLIKRLKKKGIPVIVHGHSTREDFRYSFKMWRLMAPFYCGWFEKCYRKADMVLTPTSYSKYLIKSHGYNENTYDVSNGISLEDYAHNEEYSEAFYKGFSKYGIKKGDKFVIGVGFPFERKGIDDFFAVAARFPEVKFIWFGYLKRILVNEKVARWIRHKPSNVIMPGYCSGQLIKGAYQNATCLFFPSREETEGIVVLEALATRCPLVVRDIGVYYPWLKDGINAHVEKGLEGFTSTIANLLDHGEDPEILENGYKVAEERSLQKVGEELKMYYSLLLSKKK